MAEAGVDVARDASGRWRHPARRHHARPDLSPTDVPRLTSPPGRRGTGAAAPVDAQPG
ncbi:ATP-dependent DNA ligase [Streptomyces incanus]|uniref:ATP-dependent DNA ligase n=1 Tax=Streptomyces incanus TaxID=887453 RepID=A0ABW0XM91_9ACTN